MDGDLARDDGRSLSSQLQDIVDEASRVLGRGMILADRHRLLAHTPHGDDEVDRYRLMSIMKQGAYPAEFLEWVDRHGRWSSDRPIRIPPNPDLEYDGRVVAPIYCQGHHLGSLSCTDRDETMTEADLERLGAFAEEAAIVLYSETLLQDLNRSRERELLRDIVSGDEEVRSDAAWQIEELGLFTAGGRVAVVVVPLDDADDDRSPESARVAMEAVLMRIRRSLAPKHSLHLLRPSHALILVSLADPGIRAQGLSAFAARVRDVVAESSSGADDGGGQIVAVGGVVRGLAGAVTSYQQALRTAKVAATVSTFGDVVCWDELGIYQMLTEMPVDGFGASALHPGLTALLESPRSREFLPTLERYLELAGDMQQTAASLYLHRTTLYHRLRRIEEVAGVDLRNGEHRLALHLSLKIARLQGITWPAEAADGDAKGSTSRA